MKINLIFCAIIVFICSGVIFAQSITVRPKRIVYKRKDASFPKERKTFVITYPVISGAISPTTKKNLEDTISYWRIFETPLKEYFEDTYLESLSYKINFNKNGILDISLIQEGIGAYPSTQTINLIVDLKTGKQINFKDVFNENLIGRLAILVGEKLQAEKKRMIRDINTDKYLEEETKEEKETAKETINELKFTTENFNEFSVNDRGIIILYDAGFPHAILALQPEGRYFFSWSEIKPFIKSQGLLGKFVR